MTTQLPLHGGDLAAAEARWGRPAEGWLDLSTGISPWPYPLPDIPAGAWTRLPGIAEHDALLETAARAWGVPAAARVVAAAGSQPLIQAVPRLLPPGCRVAILSPTYGEHARAWTAAGHEVTECHEVAAMDGGGAAVVVNPNNPDGRRHDPATLAALAESLAARGGLLLVDEAFGEVAPELSLAAGTAGNGLVVLRSFGKFHGLAGLRLGFALTNPALAARLTAMMGPWAVSGPALHVGRLALADAAWAEAARARLRDTAEGLRRVLTKAGLDVAGGTDLFLLARHDHADALYQRLGQAGILVRAFAARPQWLRFGLPPGQAALDRLEQSLMSNRR